ncbi:hypothetical protein [Campylobacter sp. US33a]|uniref:Tetratricopeptide repeat protein n=1 Tax=Campylobacter sp. CCS1377 TaxID=3158229 RepID=A0AAU7E850_9BACT|nr:hypothetical protein [Campylobacter sp. US33a]MCW1360875.1 hypothetical protein [Campylobacter jejuni]TEY03024.1 hypothetical protein ELQ16_03490 [Campylobacter sp. US33a]
MDFFFVEYRDPVVGLIFLTILILIVALLHYFWQIFANKDESIKLDQFIKKFELDNTHKDLLKNLNLSHDNLLFLASVFTKSGEFEKATQIYLIALEKTKDKSLQENVFYLLAQSYFKAGFLERSSEILLNILKKRPRNEKALKMLKVIYLRLKKYNEVLEILECLFELGFDIKDEKAFIKALIIQNESNKSLEEKSTQSLALDDDNALLRRFIFQNYKIKTHTLFEEVIDLLYNEKKAIFTQDPKYKEFFYALNLLEKEENFNFTNPKFKMLKILNDNAFKTKLDFSYMCLNCKNTMPLFFYHCPICYEFKQCKILYEIKSDEAN